MKKKQYDNKSFGVFSEENELIFIFQLFCWYKKQNFLEKLRGKKQKINLTSFHGMCVKDNLPHKTSKQLKETFEKYIDNFYKKYKCNGLSVALPPFADSLRPENYQQINPLIYYNFSPYLGYTYIIDLTQEKSTIQANYVPTTRNLITRTIKENNITIIETGGSNDDYQTLKHLNDVCYDNQDTKKKLTEEYLSALWEIIKDKKICRCFFAKEAEEITCYIILLYHKDCAYYFWGGGVHNSQNTQRYLLHSLIMQCKDENLKWFEVGAANIWLRGGKDKSISDYKKSFSHQIHPIFKGSYIPQS